MMLTTAIAAMGLIKTGKVRVLGVAGTARQETMPDVLTFAEQGWPNYQISEWKAVAAPAGTPPEVVAMLNRSINQVLRGEQVSNKLREEGSEVAGGTSEAMMTLVKADIERWRVVARKANISIE